MFKRPIPKGQDPWSASKLTGSSQILKAEGLLFTEHTILPPYTYHSDLNSSCDDLD